MILGRVCLVGKLRIGDAHRERVWHFEVVETVVFEIVELRLSPSATISVREISSEQRSPSVPQFAQLYKL